MLPKNRDYMAEPILDWILNEVPQSVNVKLFDDIGFIYEAQLAKMELSSWWRDLKSFQKRAAYYEEVDGQKTYHCYISDIRGKGQIGRTNQYLTHWYYPYKAKFHPQMIKALINWMGIKKGQKLLDPFVGSGTALIEAKLIGVQSIGVDIDPLCVLMSKVKTDLLELSSKKIKSVKMKEAFNYFELMRRKPSSIGLEKFTQADVIPDLKSVFQEMDYRVYNFYLLSYLYALSDWTYIKRDMWKGFHQNTSTIIKSIEKFYALKREIDFDLGSVEVKHGDARFLSELGIGKETVDGIITSPPYSIAVDYIKQDLHAFKYLGIEPQSLQDKLVGLKGKGDERIRIYFEDMERAFSSMHEVLKPRSYCAVVIGDVMYGGKRLPITQKYIEIAKSTGFELVSIIRRPILGGYARLRYEYVIVFRRD